MQNRIVKQGIFANPIVGIEISDCDGRITETNAAFCHLVGYDEAELIGLSVGDLCHQDDQERELNERRKLIEGDRDHLTFQKRYRTKAGKIIWGSTNVTVVRDNDGNCEALVAMMVDATAQHRQEILQQGRTQVLEQLYRNCSLEEVCTAIVESIEAVEEGLLCSILRLNPTTGRLHKAAAPSLPDFYNDAVEGMKIGHGVGSCGAAAFTGQRVVVADILNHPFWARVKTLVEKTTLRSCWSQPIFAVDGKVLGTFAIYYTEPREPGPFELELISSAADLTALAINHKQAQAALLKHDQLKSEFISTAAHEMNTPLAAIMGYAELLRNPDEFGPFSREQNNEFLDVICEKTEMLSRVVNDFLDISKIESDHRLGLQKKATAIHKMITKVVSHFKQHAPKHIFTLSIDEGFPETLIIDEGRIVQVLENLFSNAVKYSPEGGTVELTAGEKSGQWMVSVADGGIGMNDEQLAQVFDKFYRADASDTSVHGLGLGMSIAKEIVEAHGGDIRVTSVMGEGTRVHFTLPKG